MIRCGSRSFFMASLLLRQDVREAAYAVYAFCRLSDDAVDVEGGEADVLARLRARLDLVFAGEPGPEPVDRALTDAMLRFGIPRAAMDALLEGLEWDAAGRTYETLSDVYAYAARVAGSVGAVMAALMGARSRDLVSRACDLGVAMQLTNIARDVGEDARAGRLYLPRAWLREAGIDPEAWLADPVFTPQIGQLVARLLAEAEALYSRADAGIANLDPQFRPAMFAARHLYAGIGHRLAAKGLDSVNHRASVPVLSKMRIVAHALRCAMASAPRTAAAPPLEETRFLLEAMGEATAWPVGAGARRRVSDDFAWTLDLFAALEWRQRAKTPVH